MTKHLRSRHAVALALAGALALTVAGAARGAQHDQHDHRSEYADQAASDVAALSAEEISQLLAGDGMGLARAAELNSYPGPKHVLELAGELGLSTEQQVAITAVRERMLEAAVAQGERIVEAERTLDQRFQHAHIDEAAVRNTTVEIGRMTGELRAIHLVAHLETRALLTTEQIDRYNGLRGYTAGP